MESNRDQIKITMAIVMLASFLTPFLSNAINLAIPLISKEFGATQSLMNWVLTSFLISTAACLLPFGQLADQYGRKRIFLSGMILLAVSSLGCALAPSIIILIIFRVVQGIASGMVLGNSMAILTSAIPPESRGKALGFNSAMTYIGLSCSPVIGGFFSNTLGWRSLFYLHMIVAAFTIVLTVWKFDGEWKSGPSKLDSGGIALCIIAQVLLLFGLTKLAASLLYQISFALGIIILIAFFHHEKRCQNPIIPVDSIMKNNQFVFSTLATLINYSATFALSFLLSLYLQAVLNLDVTIAGLILLVQPVLMAVLSPVTGTLSDRFQPTILASLGMGITALGLFFFIFISTETPIMLIILNLTFIGIGFAFFTSPNMNSIMSSADKTLYGVASSIVGNMRLLGQSISMAVVALITSVIVGNLSIGSPGYVDKLMPSIRLSFMVFTVLCLLGIKVGRLGYSNSGYAHNKKLKNF